MGRKVKCLYCGEEYTRTQYPEHLEKNHKDEYFRLIEKIKSDIESDFSIKDTAANNDVTCAFEKNQQYASKRNQKVILRTSLILNRGSLKISILKQLLKYRGILFPGMLFCDIQKKEKLCSTNL